MGALVSLLALGACGNVAAPADPDQQASLGLPPSLSCQGGMDGGVVGNVEVKPGRSCVLNDMRVRGNIKVLEGATLELTGGTVEGNVEGDKAFAIEMRGTRVEGNVQVQESQFVSITDALIGGSIQIKTTSHAGDGMVLVANNDVPAGNIQIEDNHVLRLEVSGNLVKGNLQVVKNVGGGEKLVAGNRVSQNLQCGENWSPFVAQDNSAGEREGQCR
jgi:hypothetical protein